jgi:hypothetical protein
MTKCYFTWGIHCGQLYNVKCTSLYVGLLCVHRVTGGYWVLITLEGVSDNEYEDGLYKLR